jgi:peptidoglycan/xylan/chitin deacetylase (PgdA/CDA1 family)
VRELLGRVPVFIVGGPESASAVRQAGARFVSLGRPSRAAARNTGFAAAEAEAGTELVAFGDARSQPSAGWLRALEDSIGDHAAVLAAPADGGAGSVRLVSRTGRRPAAGPWVSPANSSGLFRRRPLREVGVFSPLVRYWDDLYITARLWGYGNTVGQAQGATAEAAASCGRWSLNRRSGYWLADLQQSGELRDDRVERFPGARADVLAARAGQLTHRFSQSPRPASLLPVRLRGRAPDGVHLTIDDGPSPNTPKLLGILRRHGARADFFVIGKQAAQYPDLTTDIVSEGHAVHNHTLTHRQLDGLSQDEITAELAGTARLIDRHARPGRPRVRLPFGAGADDLYVQEAVRRWRPSAEIVQWSVDSYDYKYWPRCHSQADVDREARDAADRVLSTPDLPGSIVLMHDNAFGARLPLAERFSRVLLDRMLTGFAELGLETTPLGGTES